MPKPIRRCLRCRHILPPWARSDARYCGGTCRQAAHREHYQWRRRLYAKMRAAGPLTARERTEQTDIEALMAATDATAARVMEAVAKIVKRGAASA